MKFESSIILKCLLVINSDYIYSPPSYHAITIPLSSKERGLGGELRTNSILKQLLIKVNNIK